MCSQFLSKWRMPHRNVFVYANQFRKRQTLNRKKWILSTQLWFILQNGCHECVTRTFAWSLPRFTWLVDSCQNRMKTLWNSIGKNYVCESFYFVFVLLILLLLMLPPSECISVGTGSCASIEINRSPTITNTVPNHHSGVVRSPKTTPPIAAYARVRWRIEIQKLICKPRG